MLIYIYIYTQITLHIKDPSMASATKKRKEVNCQNMGTQRNAFTRVANINLWQAKLDVTKCDIKSEKSKESLNDCSEEPF